MTATPVDQPIDRSPLPELATVPGTWRGRFWVSDEPLSNPGYYPACVAAFEHSGLWPVLIPRDARFTATGQDWVADRGGLVPAEDTVASIDAGETLARWWRSGNRGGSKAGPLGADFPGLTSRCARRVDPVAEAGNTGCVLSQRGTYRLGLMPVRRPADIPAALGWSGMANSTDQVAEVSSVLRSWEDRFGATLVVLGFDSLQLSVAWAPRSMNRALTLAAEHRAFCANGNTFQQGGMRELAGELTRQRLWSFRWD